MRFVVTGEWKKNDLLRLVIFMFLVFVLLFWVTNALLFFQSMSLDPQRVIEHYLGKKSEWADPVPRSYKVLLEITHAHMFAMAILIMTMTHLVLFVPAPGWIKAALTVVTFGSALLNEASGWLIRYWHPGFAWLKISMFLLFQLSLLGIIVVLFLALFSGWRNAYADK